jgi:hypothetical protein
MERKKRRTKGSVEVTGLPMLGVWEAVIIIIDDAAPFYS